MSPYSPFCTTCQLSIPSAPDRSSRGCQSRSEIAGNVSIYRVSRHIKGVSSHAFLYVSTLVFISCARCSENHLHMIIDKAWFWDQSGCMYVCVVAKVKHVYKMPRFIMGIYFALTSNSRFSASWIPAAVTQNHFYVACMVLGLQPTTSTKS